MRVRERPRIGDDRIKNREDIVLRKNSVNEYYVRLDIPPRQRVQNTAPAEAQRLEIISMRPSPPAA
ncbi:hypothetical protein GG804_01870 [Sphingomonas histidinilytica]|uniref:hypothetical protein n=1 Tax=Rhizorhabdus histidinilytica TaxID=439228 RepID=UPI001ADC86A2|nr:hypothetical protein [Rhizorhabdus histidinilytica]MBO9375505.1 hypothetical protein [Rhizorhabdus histidinilytica]